MQIKADTLGDSFPSYTSISKWAGLFRRDRESIEDQPQVSLTDDWRCGEIAEAIGISIERLDYILIEELAMRELPRSW